MTPLFQGQPHELSETGLVLVISHDLINAEQNLLGERSVQTLNICNVIVFEKLMNTKKLFSLVIFSCNLKLAKKNMCVSQVTAGSSFCWFVIEFLCNN